MAGDIVIINQPLRRRESKAGKVRFTIDMQSEPLIFKLDAKSLGDETANAMAGELRAQVSGITAEAAPATIKARESAARVLSGGADVDISKTTHGKREVSLGRKHLTKNWAMERYSGGKLGLMLPNQTRRAFNDSGRFIKGIVAQAQPKKWVVNVPANRLDPTTGNVDRIWKRLTELVPAFGDVRLLMESAEVRGAIKRGLDSLVVKNAMTRDEISIARARNLLLLVARIVLAAAA